MVIKETPGWARWSLIIGFFLPVLSYMGLEPHNPGAGWLWNILNHHVRFSFLYGPNPFACALETIKIVVGTALQFEVHRSYACNLNTVISYRYILIASGALLVLGLYGLLRGRDMANLWPTDWRPFSEEPVSKKAKKKLNLEDPRERGINPKDGGF